MDHGCHSPGLQDQQLLEQHKQREMADSSSIFVTTEVMIIIIMQIDGDAFMFFRIEVFMFLIMIRFHVESTLACENHMVGRYPRVLSALPQTSFFLGNPHHPGTFRNDLESGSYLGWLTLNICKS